MTKKNQKSREERFDEKFCYTDSYGFVRIHDQVASKPKSFIQAERIRVSKEFIKLWAGCLFAKQQEVEMRRGDGTGKTKLNQKEWAELAREFNVLILHEVKKIEDQLKKGVK